MKADMILSTDYLDILFENRNKRYGGYELRKHYNQRACKALLAICCASLFLAVLLSARKEAGPVAHNLVVQVSPLSPVRPVNALPKPAAPHPAGAASKPVAHTSTLPKIVPDDKVRPEDIKPDIKGDISTHAGNSIAGTGGQPADSAGTGDHSTDTKKDAALAEKPLRYVAEMPEFDGDISRYLTRELHYPASARENNIEGKVTVEFVVNEDGSVSGCRVVRGIGGGCDQEALRVVSDMPKWKPGKQNGSPVKVYMLLPIVFDLN